MITTFPDDVIVEDHNAFEAFESDPYYAQTAGITTNAPFQRREIQPEQNRWQDKSAIFNLSDKEVEIEIKSSYYSALYSGMKENIVLEETQLWVMITYAEAFSEIDRINRIRRLGLTLFSRAEIFFLPEARIAFRYNSNHKALAELSNKAFYPLSIEGIRSQVVQSKGEAAWENLIKLESQRRALDIIKYQTEIE